MSGRRDENGIYANGVDIDRLLEQILSDPRLRSSKAFSTTKTYADEPIIRRGSQMDSYLPQKIGQMRELQRTPRGRICTAAAYEHLGRVKPASLAEMVEQGSLLDPSDED